MREVFDKLIDDLENKNLNPADFNLVVTYCNKKKFIEEMNTMMPEHDDLIPDAEIKYRGVLVCGSLWMQKDKVLLMPKQQFDELPN